MSKYLKSILEMTTTPYSPVNLDAMCASESSSIRPALTLIWAKAAEEGGDYVDMLAAMIDSTRRVTGDDALYAEMCFLTHLLFVREWPRAVGVAA